MVNSTHKTLRIVTKEFLDFDILKNDIKLFSHYFMDFHMLKDDIDDSRALSLKGLIDCMQEHHIPVYINGIPIRYIPYVKDCSIMLHYDTVGNQEDTMNLLSSSSNTIYMMFEPETREQLEESSYFIDKWNKEYPGFHYLVYLSAFKDSIPDALNKIRDISSEAQRKLMVVGAGKCHIEDTDEFILDYPLDFKEVYKYDAYPGKVHSFLRERISFLQKSSKCKLCARNSDCFGIRKNSNIRIIEPTQSTLNKQYNTQPDFFYNGTFFIDSDVLLFDPYHPSDMVNSRLSALQRRRLVKDFEGPNFYSIIDSSSSFYFNRPLETENLPLWSMSEKGLPALNIQYIGKGIPEQEVKTDNDQLVPEHGLSVLSKIKFFDDWNEQDRKDIEDFTFDALKDIIIENGGNSDSLTQIDQDLFYNGKKFAGKEWKFDSSRGYTENTIIFCSYISEKQWVDKRNNNSIRKQLTGITDELPKVTKELLTDELDKRAKRFFGKLNDKLYLK